MATTRSLFVIGALALAAQSAFAVNVHFSNIVPSPSNFNGFEGAPAMFGGFGPTYTEDGITVTQANMSPSGIWTTYLTPTDPWGYYGTFEGDRSWYPYNGDNGYTVITMADNSAFSSVSMLIGSGYTGSLDVGVYYELAFAGNVVFSGTYQKTYEPNWLGFSGGGFDEIRLRDNNGAAIAGLTGGYNALAIDSIGVGAVPEPGTYALMLGGLVALGAFARRKAG